MRFDERYSVIPQRKLDGAELLQHLGIVRYIRFRMFYAA
jgi:hypothetical protein